MAVGIIKNWAHGHNRGRRVHADVQAAASANLAKWEALKARAKATPNKGGGRDRRLSVELATRFGASQDGEKMTTPFPPKGKKGKKGGFKKVLASSKTKADLGKKGRKQLASKGSAIPDKTVGGRFPISNAGDVARAVKAIGRAKPGDRDKIKRHIKRHASRLGVSHLTKNL